MHPDEGYPSRREHEIRQVLADFRQELHDWGQAATTGDLEKHGSQIHSVTRVLLSALDQVDALPAAQKAERSADILLDLHHLWDFFRGKLMMRSLPSQRIVLDAADELAWSLYQPLRLAATSGTPAWEPPLTFFGRHPVPFAMPRGSAFEKLLPFGKQRTRDGQAVAQHLPFPLIGIPWSSGRHLPALLAVAHETGHHIEDDLRLTASLTAHLRGHAGLEPASLVRWERWLGEAFADICATLACGSAYLWALTDAMTAAASQPLPDHAYPPPRLRALICRAALPGSAQESLPPLPGEPHPTDDEAQAVFVALAEQGIEELGGRSLRSLLGLRRPEGVPVAANRLLHSLRSERRDVEGVLAAATLAFVRDPSGFVDGTVGLTALDEVLRLRPKGPRAVPAKETGREERDRASGEGLFALLLSRH
ncbi:hypothetical protein ACWDM8_29340 [Streptomyces rubiginosohelvolus]